MEEGSREGSKEDVTMTGRQRNDMLLTLKIKEGDHGQGTWTGSRIWKKKSNEFTLQSLLKKKKQAALLALCFHSGETHVGVSDLQDS